MRRLFVFRPEPAAGRTVDRARALGLDAIALPLFEVEAVEWTAPDPSDFDALLLTSANAVTMGGEKIAQLRGLPVHVVGEATAVAAEVAGFGVKTVGKVGVDELLKSVCGNARLLHLCGEDRREPSSATQEITAIPVYRARPIDRVAGLNQLDCGVALVHSPRAARRLAELVSPESRSTIRLAAISAAAAAAAGDGWMVVRAAQLPSDEALLALAARLCDT